MSITTKLNLWN